MHGCNIADNGEYDVHLTSKLDSTTTIDATNNWWGVVDSAAIEENVFHHPDSSICPNLDYVPFAGSPFMIDDSTITDVPGGPDDLLPGYFVLEQNYPNPFNGSTVISFDLARRAQVTLRVCNVLGQTVATLINEDVAAGRHRVVWDGRDEYGGMAASGVYFYYLQTDAFVESRKMVLLK